MKSKVYKTVVRPVLLYGTETWAAEAEHLRELATMEMKCLRRVVGCTLWDRRRNEDICGSQGSINYKESEGEPIAVVRTRVQEEGRRYGKADLGAEGRKERMWAPSE